MRFLVTATVILTLLPGLGPAQQPAHGKRSILKLQIAIPVFPDGGALPRKYACATKSDVSISPPIQWSGAPAETMSFALIMHRNDSPIDPLRWGIFNIPATASGLSEGVPNSKTLGDGSVQIRNYDGSIGYAPMDVRDAETCPTQPLNVVGSARFQFEVFALDTKLDPATKNRDTLEKAMKGHVLAKGTYSAVFAP